MSRYFRSTGNVCRCQVDAPQGTRQESDHSYLEQVEQYRFLRIPCCHPWCRWSCQSFQDQASSILFEVRSSIASDLLHFAARLLDAYARWHESATLSSLQPQKLALERSLMLFPRLVSWRTPPGSLYSKVNSVNFGDQKQHFCTRRSSRPAIDVRKISGSAGAFAQAGGLSLERTNG